MTNNESKNNSQREIETEQETFWRGNFGDNYSSRNDFAALARANTHFFGMIFSHLGRPPCKVVELGPNIGLNLAAIKNICPSTKTVGIEINSSAHSRLVNSNSCDLAINQSLLTFDAKKNAGELSFTKGVLIHVSPEKLELAYSQLYNCSTKFIMVCEYYSPKPLSIEYRGQSEKLFKRDFASDMLDLYPDLSLKAYGFLYHRDNIFPQDDLTWFLMEKSNQNIDN